VDAAYLLAGGVSDAAILLVVGVSDDLQRRPAGQQRR
jgi:hypothetical protein